MTGFVAQSYNAAELSDGERVIFYLIGQALLAPQDGTIVIDEPELHVHQSIQSPLWNAIEAERQDCRFVYLTHDMDFAASRANATKICLRGFDGERWDWYQVPKNSEIPEDVLLQILGSRKPIIFTEGDRGSLDYFVYQKLYPNFTIVPSGGCNDVVRATRSFDSLSSLHRLSVHGLVDLDFRDANEAENLRSRGVEVLDFSELENIFLTEGVLRIAAEKLSLTDFQNLFDSVRVVVFEEMEKNKDALISSITARKIERVLNKFDSKARGESGLSNALSTLTGSVDVTSLYKATETEVRRIIDSKDYDAALKIFNNKGLIYMISGKFGFKSDGLIDFIKRLMSDKDNEPLLAVMRDKTPRISV